MEEIILIGKEKEDILSETLKQELKSVFKENDKIAIKLHMGEKGNTYYLKPDFVKIVVDILKGLNVKPFLFDSPVIYPGGRDTIDKYYETGHTWTNSLAFSGGNEKQQFRVSFTDLQSDGIMPNTGWCCSPFSC